MRTREVHVRQALHAQVLAVHRSEPDTIVVDEFALDRGAARIDVAVVNGELQGYEIKSASDTLERLATQVPAYSAILDRVTLVADCRHLERATNSIPPWWGVCAVSMQGGAVVLAHTRAAALNLGADAERIAQLLWHEEQLALLASCGHTRAALKRMNRRSLARILATSVDLATLRSGVRSALKARYRASAAPSQ